MHQGRPYGLHVIGGDLTDKDAARISSAAVRFTNLKELLQLDSLKLVYDLPDGGSFIVQDMGGNFRVIAHKPSHQTYELSDGIAKDYIPMLFSGVVSKGALLRQGQGLALTLTEETRRRILGYTEQRSPKEVRLLRFSCPYTPMFYELLPLYKVDGIVYTQYDKQRPTWYSGAMAEVIQIVGGYGRQDFYDLPDNQLERAKFDVPFQFLERIKNHISEVRLPAYTGLPNLKGQFQCDYKFANTDIISFDSNNEPWLVKVNNQGVWAMPMPIIPATKSPAFREYIESVGDNEVLKILDRFGAMPSGEGFPTGFYEWVRAGVIIKVCSTLDFYQHSAYSSAMGWSANLRGNEVVNTCYDVDDSTGIFYSKAYMLDLNLDAAVDAGWLKSGPDLSLLNNYEKGLIDRYLSSLYSAIQKNNDINLAIKYKLRRCFAADILARAKKGFDKQEVEYWRNLELTPIANHKGSMSVISQGDIYRANNIKVPEPYSEGCVSFDFLPKKKDYVEDKSDVIVLAYFMGDDLKTIHYFNDPRIVSVETETDFEDIMIVGDWKRVTHSGNGSISGSLYTTDIDYRKVLSPSITTTKIKGRDMGYGAPIFEFPNIFFKDGLFYRRRYYSTETTTNVISGSYLRDAVVIPYFFRGASVFAYTEGAAKDSYNWDIKSQFVLDPNIYLIWTYHFIFAYRGGLAVENGNPYPVDGHPVYAEILDYNPNVKGGFFADQGAWLGGLPENIEPKMYGYTSSTVWANKGVPPQPHLEPKSDKSTTTNTINSKLLANFTDKTTLITTKPHSDDYYISSPNFLGQVFYIDGSKVTFGNIEYANTSIQKDSGGRTRWGDTILADHKSAHHFIGVINE